MKRSVSTTTFVTEGKRNEALIDRISQLEESASQGAAYTGNAPSLCAGGFVIPTAYEKFKKGLRATFCVEVPAGTQRLKTVIIRVSDAADATNYLNKRINASFEITDGRTHLEYRFDPRLEYGTAYRLIRLIAIDINGNRTFFPSAEQAFSDSVPAEMLFTTPTRFPAPSGPSASLIFRNQEDPKTRALDAFVELGVIAPLTDGGAAQAWSASPVDELSVILHRTDFSPSVRVDVPVYKIQSQDTELYPTSTPPNRGLIRVIAQGLRYGAPYSWIKNRAWDIGEFVDSTEPAVDFTAGNASTNPNLLTGVSLQLDVTEPFDGVHRFATLLLTQPATVVALKHVTVRTKLTTELDSAYKAQIPKFSLQDTAFHIAGPQIIPLKKIKLKASKTYTVQIQITAIGGTQLILTTTVGPGVSDTVENDTAVPSGLAQPQFYFVAKSDWMFQGLQATTNIHTLKDRKVGITNGATYFDLPTYIASGRVTIQSASASSARLSVNKGHGHVEVRLRDLQTLFGASANVFLDWTAVNDIGESGPSALSIARNLASPKDFVNPSDAVTTISSGAVPAGQQELPNADWLIANGAGILDRWFQYDTATLPISGGGTTTITTASSNIRWFDTTHSVAILNQTRWLLCNLRKALIHRGEKLSLVINVKANTGLTGMSLRIRVRADDTGQDQLSSFATFVDIPLTGLSTSYQEYAALLRISDTARLIDGASAVLNQFLLIEVIGTLGANQIELARPILVRGADPPKWSLRPDDRGLMDAPVTGVTSTPEVVTAVGTPGGYTTQTSVGVKLDRWGELVA